MYHLFTQVTSHTQPALVTSHNQSVIELIVHPYNWNSYITQFFLLSGYQDSTATQVEWRFFMPKKFPFRDFYLT
ncbi:hypothetical protein VIBNIMADA3020_290064 [Vibrio nigripulchritudo MADA3020]|nr:hypothetical protein VIBNIMADA3020_290064 [Vibrio nigripulchritudo MADA3020]CCN50961.1 hypothetical protein VIBNIMADA3021_10064 [Vibrio nigripulchritudo MADA3021]